jgi:hypothetical protein
VPKSTARFFSLLPKDPEDLLTSFVVRILPIFMLLLFQIKLATGNVIYIVMGCLFSSRSGVIEKLINSISN